MYPIYECIRKRVSWASFVPFRVELEVHALPPRFAVKRWLAWVLVVFAMHFVWEMAQAKWYASMQGLPFWPATVLCMRAAAMDILITLVSFIAAAWVARSSRWALQGTPPPMVVFFAIGLAITIAIELFALSTGRWRYDPRMPRILGFGLAPLLQWVAIPAAALGVFRRIFGR